MTLQLTPPVHAKREAGDVQRAELLEFKLKHPNAAKRRSYAQQLGLRYERKVLVHLLETLDKNVIFQPAFRFRSAGTAFDQFAIPDALYLSPSNVLTIFEIKLRHTADAWYQLKRLYLPIIQKAYPAIDRINLVEICANYDNSIKLPSTTIVDDLAAWTAEARPQFGVYLWSGRVR
jgi:hypothetical protein